MVLLPEAAILVTLAAYTRVSTADQDAALQRDAIARYAPTTPITWYADVASGAMPSRPALDRLMRDVRAGKVAHVVVYKFDRFARSTRHLLAALEEFRSRGVAFTSLTEGLDTTTAMGRLVFTFLAAIAEFERELIRERVVAGLDAARRRGVRLGPRPVPIDLELARLYLGDGLTMAEVARRLKVKRPTLIDHLAAAVGKPRPAAAPKLPRKPRKRGG